jgi:hypothetical protein
VLLGDAVALVYIIEGETHALEPTAEVDPLHHVVEKNVEEDVETHALEERNRRRFAPAIARKKVGREAKSSMAVETDNGILTRIAHPL